MPTSTSAVVIGGSLAGMCAARVLSDFVDNVTIIERDAYPSAHEFRPGVPQARHVHNLLARGLRELEGFFPGFEQRMRECGAVAVESGWDVATRLPNGWSQRYHTGLWQLYASRPLIESAILELCPSAQGHLRRAHGGDRVARRGRESSLLYRCRSSLA